MLYDRIRHEDRQFSTLDQISQKKSVFPSSRQRVEQISVCRDLGSPNGKTRGVQVSNATVRLEQMILKCNQTQLLGSADLIRTVANQMKLKRTLKRHSHSFRIESRETIGLDSTVSVNENQHGPLRFLNSSIPRGRNSCVTLTNDSEAKTVVSITDGLWDRLSAAVID
jgi:hypothetical protein